MANKIITSIFLIFAVVCIHSDELNETSTSTELNICDDDNNTCSTFSTESSENVTDEIYTTEIYTNETINITVTTESPKLNQPHINYDKQRNNDIDFCQCDLQIDYCDINCCCDKNCTNDQKSLFSNCESIHDFHDPHYCYSVKTTYVNQTMIYEEEAEHRLFCVLKSNLPAHHFIQIDKPIDSIDRVENIISKQYKWPTIESKNVEIINAQNLDHKYGSNVWIQINNTEFVPLTLPDKFLSNICAQKKQIRFLEDFTSSCTQSFIDENNSALNSETYYKNISVFTMPKNVSVTEKYALECGKNNCIPINAFICNDEYLTNCETINGTDIKIFCHFSPYRNEHSCSNLVQKIKYDFYHNITGELTKVNLYLFLSNATYFLDENFEFFQSFEVKYFWHGFKQNFSSMISGNPGYLLGKYILFGELIINTTNNATGKYKISKNDYDITKNILVLPKNQKGMCIFTNDSYFPIQFGYNVQNNCVFQHKINISENATTQCVNLQKSIFQMWQINTSRNHEGSRKYIGMYGNSNRLKISEWIEITYKFNDAKILQEIVGDYKSNKLICKNIVHILKINFVYANVDFDHAKRQSKILNVIYNLQVTEYLSSSIFVENDLNLINTDLRVEIFFFDVTKPAKIEYAKPPTFHVSLSHDFFYPFLMNNQILYISNFKLIIYMIGILIVCN